MCSDIILNMTCMRTARNTNLNWLITRLERTLHDRASKLPRSEKSSALSCNTKSDCYKHGLLTKSCSTKGLNPILEQAFFSQCLF